MNPSSILAYVSPCTLKRLNRELQQDVLEVAVLISTENRIAENSIFQAHRALDIFLTN